MANRGTTSARVIPIPVTGIEDPDLRAKLRMIVQGEHTSCQLLQLELIAAIETSKPGPEVEMLAQAALAALAQTEQAYAQLLAELDRRSHMRVSNHPVRSVQRRPRNS